eukprot:CAMPEP_0184859894 /NCGR_PEP_ID=MMETSP0580-20130426/4857_1 /TAXON_ID=1118495 /ORGANISM="Dactyliosolen fragilissimus" /LENGTH=632 /DNA_ID=CAMNT_0027356759 /DNA_START=171 /DNA_END=2069 /DNA_ORIENTATION=+
MRGICTFDNTKRWSTSIRSVYHEISFDNNADHQFQHNHPYLAPTIAAAATNIPTTTTTTTTCTNPSNGSYSNNNVHHNNRNKTKTSTLNIPLFRFMSRNITIISNDLQSRSFSTPSEESNNNSNNNNSNSINDSIQTSLRRLARPFLLAYHPDRLPNMDETSKSVNLCAVQTLNGMIDTLQILHDRAIPNASSTNTSTPTATYANAASNMTQLESKYEIEFVVPSTTSNDNHHNTHYSGHDENIFQSTTTGSPTTMTVNSVQSSLSIRKSKHNQTTTTTRRSVDLTFSQKDREALQLIDPFTKRYDERAARHIWTKGACEIGKLLRVAGLTIPSEIRDLENAYDNDQWECYNQMDEELGLGLNWNTNDIDSSTTQFQSSFGRTRKKTPRELARERFYKRTDWNKLRQLYDEAFEDAERDIATQGLIRNNEERKRELVANVVSRIRIQKVVTNNNNNNSNNNTHSTNTASSDDHHDPSLLQDPIEQLIATRRISLLFLDHFDTLQMEDMGRLWESIVIVLTPARKNNNRSNHHQNHNINSNGNASQENDNSKQGPGIPYSRLRRLTRARESGYKFAFHDGGRLTAYIPIDFLEDELLNEFKRHLRHFHSLLIDPNNDLESFLPPYFKQFQSQP